MAKYRNSALAVRRELEDALRRQYRAVVKLNKIQKEYEAAKTVVRDLDAEVQELDNKMCRTIRDEAHYNAVGTVPYGSFNPETK